jgi:hypothetical protein
MIHWADTHSGFVQALGSLVLAAIAWWNIRLARRLLSAPYETQVNPVWILGKVAEADFRVRNHGPGIALDVVVSAVALGRGRIRSTPISVEVSDGTVATGLTGTLVRDFSVLLSWSTADHRRRKSYWAEGDRGRPIRLTKVDRIVRTLKRWRHPRLRRWTKVSSP